MKAIEITNINRQPSYTEVSYVFRFPVPAALMNAGKPYTNVAKIVQTYGYDAEVVNESGVDVTYITFSETASTALSPTLAQFKTFLQSKYTTKASVVAAFVLKPYDTLLSGYFDGTNWIIS